MIVAIRAHVQKCPLLALVSNGLQLVLNMILLPLSQNAPQKIVAMVVIVLHALDDPWPFRLHLLLIELLPRFLKR